MRLVRFILAVLSTAGIIAMAWYAYAVFLADPMAGKEEYEGAVAQGLQALKISDPGWQLMVLAVTREVEAPREKVWEAWAKLEDWPVWSVPMHRVCFWIGDREWKAGARFQQTVRMSWPEEEFKSTERVVQAFAPDRVSYVREEGPFQSYRSWKFEFLPGGMTRITSVQVIHGSDVGFIRPLVQAKWQLLHERALDGLVAYVRRQK